VCVCVCTYMYIYIYTHTHTHTHTHISGDTMFIHSFIHSYAQTWVTNIYQKDTSSYFEATFLFQAFSSISYIMKQYVSESGFATIPRCKPISWSPQKELPAVTKHCCQLNWPRYVSKIRSRLWRVTRNKVEGSFFYGADQIGLHLRTEA